MNWHLVTYADENFVEQQKYLHQIHKEGFVHHPFNRKQLESTKFYEDHKKILDSILENEIVIIKKTKHYEHQLTHQKLDITIEYIKTDKINNDKVSLIYKKIA